MAASWLLTLFSHNAAMPRFFTGGQVWNPIWSWPPSNTSSSKASPNALEEGECVIHPFACHKEKFFGIHLPKGAASLTWSAVSKTFQQVLLGISPVERLYQHCWPPRPTTSQCRLGPHLSLSPQLELVYSQTPCQALQCSKPHLLHMVVLDLPPCKV